MAERDRSRIVTSDAVSYALSRATGDVADTIRWLEAEGFVCANERGGPEEAFGDLLLEFERDVVRATITHQRGQWMVDIAAGEGKSYGLHVWLTAIRGTSANPGPSGLDELLPAQLPPGESWRAVVPAVITWVMRADRSAEIEAAAQDWRRAMSARLGDSR